MKRPQAVILVAISASLASAAFAAPKPKESWGRAGVDLETYRSDAIECAAMAYYADISETEHAAAFQQGTRRLEAADDSSLGQAGASAGDDMSRMVSQASRIERIRASVRPEWRIRALQEGLQTILDNCLLDRGYSRFVLTDEQRAYIGHLPKGSQERRLYMHSLASNPEVLRLQLPSDERHD